MRVAILTGVLMFALLTSGCGPQNAPAMSLTPGPRPSGSPKVEPCYITTIQPAKIFAVSAASDAHAGETISLIVWIYRPYNEFPIQNTFVAKLTDDHGVVSVTGKVNRTNLNPKASRCVEAAGAPDPFAATLSVPVTLPAGSYTILIPPSHYIAQVPPNPLGVDPWHPFVKPPANASISLDVR